MIWSSSSQIYVFKIHSSCGERSYFIWKGSSHNFFYRSNLIFFMVMGCGILCFGPGASKPPKFGSWSLFPGTLSHVLILRLTKDCWRIYLQAWIESWFGSSFLLFVSTRVDCTKQLTRKERQWWLWWYVTWLKSSSKEKNCNTCTNLPSHYCSSQNFCSSRWRFWRRWWDNCFPSCYKNLYHVT